MGDSLASVIFDGNDQTSPFVVGSMNLDGRADPTIPATQDNWTLYRASATIPSLAESAMVVIRGIAPPGSATSGNQGFVDLVSLQVVPEPSAAAMLAVGILGLAILVRTTRRTARRFGNRTRQLDKAANLPDGRALHFFVAWPENASCNEGGAS
jgi:hypothetical protein